MSLFVDRLHAHLAADLEREILYDRFLGVDDKPRRTARTRESEATIAVDRNPVLAGKRDSIEAIVAVAAARRLPLHGIGDIDKLDRRIGDRFSILVGDAATQRRLRRRLVFRLVDRGR